MRVFNFAGLATPWRAIYLAKGYENDPQIIAHELKHLEQMDRDGTFTFCIRYAAQLMRYGYWNAPYEIEAREAAKSG